LPSEAAGCTEIPEKISGAKSIGNSWLCIARLGAGDVLVVTRLDRLARSTRDLNMLGAVADRAPDSNPEIPGPTDHRRQADADGPGGLVEFERN
jgi:hypothetical protein